MRPSSWCDDVSVCVCEIRVYSVFVRKNESGPYMGLYLCVLLSKSCCKILIEVKFFK